MMPVMKVVIVDMGDHYCNNGGRSDDIADLYYNSSENRQLYCCFPSVYLMMLPQLHRL
jgi:hypothetical protein